MNFDKTLDFYRKKTELALKSYTDFPECKQKALFNAMKYSLFSGGKRVRPILTLAFCEACGGNIESALPAACAVEMIHTFSLIHDDLPCMDDDDFRRENLTCHKKFDEPTALLAGDALEIYPFKILADSAKHGVPPEDALKMINILAFGAGHMGMTGGQQIDVQFGNDILEENELLNIYELKTSRLLQAAACLGCVSAGAPENITALANDYAGKIGVAFQIIDDLLEADEKNKVEDKNTYVKIFGEQKSRELASKLTDEALELLDRLDDGEFLKRFTVKLLNRNK